MSKIVPLTLETPEQLQMSIRNNDLEGVSDMVVIRRYEDGSFSVSHNTMNTERMHFMGAVLTDYALRV